MTKEEKISERVNWLIKNEVYCCISHLMDNLLAYASEHPREAVIDIDEYLNSLDSCPNCYSRNFQSLHDYMEENPDFSLEAYNKEHPDEQIKEDQVYDYYFCKDCDSIFEQPEQLEVYEYWLVSKWIAPKLQAKGEIVLDSWVPIWCRCATGQALYLDSCWQEIAADIVESMKKYETAEK